MKHVLRKTQILKCTQKEIENLERPLQNKDIKLIKDFPQRKAPKQTDLLVIATKLSQTISNEEKGRNTN